MRSVVVFLLLLLLLLQVGLSFFGTHASVQKDEGFLGGRLHEKPDLLKIHERVVAAAAASSSSSSSEAPCRERLSVLRELVATGRFEDAFDLGSALPAETRFGLADECNRDVVRSGVFELVQSAVSPPPSGPSRELFFKKQQSQGGGGTVYAVIDGGKTQIVHDSARAKFFFVGKKRERESLLGLVLDGKFVLSSKSLRCEEAATTLLCEGGGRSKIAVPTLNDALKIEAALRQPNDGDDEMMQLLGLGKENAPPISLRSESSEYVTGTKRVLFIPMCYVDVFEQGDAACSSKYTEDGGEWNVVGSEFGGDIHEYLKNMLRITNDFMEHNSYGKLSLTGLYADF